MIPYIVVFIISFIFAAYSQKQLKKGNKRKCLFFLILALLPLNILAGLRSPNLGWDVKKYFIGIHNCASSFSFSAYTKYVNKSVIENGFLYLTYFLVKINPNINFCLFIFETILLISFIIYIYNYKDKIDWKISFVIYCCSLYLISYSTLRQCLALSMIFLMYVSMEKNKFFLTILFLILAISFHNSAIICISIPFIIKYFKSDKFKNKKVFMFVCITIFSFLIFSYEYILELLANVGLLSEKYYQYVNNEFHVEGIDLSFATIFQKTAGMLLCLIYANCKKINPDEKKDNLIWIFFLIIDFIVMILSFKITNIHRITYYIYFPAAFAFFPQCKKIFKKDQINQNVGELLIESIFIIFFILKMISNYYSICPYISI